MYIPTPTSKIDNKALQDTMEKKASVEYGNSQLNDIFSVACYGFSNKMRWTQITNMLAWRYYMQLSVIYNAVDIISIFFAIIPPRLWDNQESRYLTGDDKNLDVYNLLELLNAPSFGVTYNEFARKMIPNYEVTGDLFFKASASSDNREPRILEIVNSQLIDVTEEDSRGAPTQYRIDYPGETITFYKDTRTGKFNGRFFNLNRTQELWHTKIFNPSSEKDGLSPLTPLFYEIEQFIASSIHNGNLLKKGARPSGALMIDEETNLGDPQVQQLKAQIKDFYQGENSVGNVLILQGGKEFKELSVSNKDMDFANLKKSDVEQMYRNYKIPLSLVLADTMTLDNFKLALPVLYEMAILPLADIIFSEIDLFLMRRYDDTGRYKLTYNPKDIKALQVEFNMEADRLIKTGLLSKNEGRELLDYEALKGTAGEEIYNPGNLLVIGRTQAEKTLNTANNVTKDEYSELLRRNNFSDEQIKEYIEKYYNNQ